MALFNALMRYKDQRQILRFDMHGDTKATIHLINGNNCIVFMANQYIVDEADVILAARPPKAEYMIYNDWDKVSSAAEHRAQREHISIMKFGRFAYRLDEIGSE